MSPEKMGGYVPKEEVAPDEEDGVLSKLSKKLGKTGKALGVAGALLVGTPENADAQVKEVPAEYSDDVKNMSFDDAEEFVDRKIENQNRSAAADKAQAELGNNLAEDRNLEKKSVDEYTALVRKYFALRTDLSAGEQVEQADLMINYYRDVVRGREKELITVVDKSYKEAIQKEIDKLVKKKTKK